MEREKLTEAECLNLRTACLTSSMRNPQGGPASGFNDLLDAPKWAATLDALAEKMLRMADQIAAED